MNKKLFYSTTALTAVVVGGYLYYRHNKLEIEKKIKSYEDKAAELVLRLQDRRLGRTDYPRDEEGPINE